METTRRFKFVHDSDEADFSSVCVTLFPGGPQVCGWYISPTVAASVADGYVPMSARLIASSAVLRAVALAERLGVDVCIIDPDDLWSRAWGGLGQG